MIETTGKQKIFDAETITIDAAIERLGYGRFQRQVTFAAGLCLMAESMEVLLLSLLSVVLQAQWNLTIQQTSVLTSSVFLGEFLGTIILGPLGDKIGRKPVFMLAAGIITFFGVVTAFCSSLTMLILVRFVVGFGVGGLTVPFDAMAELLPISHRGRDLLFIEYFWALSTLLVPFMAYLTLDNSDPSGWRYFVALCAIPCFLSVLSGYWMVPESPRWLLTVDKADKAMKILRHGAILNGLNPDDVFPEGTKLQPEEPEASTIKDLFTPSWRWITIALWITWIGFAFLYYGTILATTLIFSDSAFETATDTFKFDYGAILVSGSAEVFGTTFAILAIDRLGRVPVQMISFFFGGFFVLLLGIFANKNIDALRPALMAFAFFARLFFHSGNSTTWVATAEILTTEIRTTGHSAANAMARIGGFVAPFIVKETTPPWVIGLVMFIIAVITTASSSELPETKGESLGMHLNKANKEVGSELEMQVEDSTIT